METLGQFSVEINTSRRLICSGVVEILQRLAQLYDRPASHNQRSFVGEAFNALSYYDK